MCNRWRLVGNRWRLVGSHQTSESGCLSKKKKKKKAERPYGNPWCGVYITKEVRIGSVLLNAITEGHGKSTRGENWLDMAAVADCSCHCHACRQEVRSSSDVCRCRYREGGHFVWALFRRVNFVGGEIHHPGSSQSSHLPHARRNVQAHAPFGGRKTYISIYIYISTESGPSTQHLKGSAVRNTCPKTMDHW